MQNASFESGIKKLQTGCQLLSHEESQLMERFQSEANAPSCSEDITEVPQEAEEYDFKTAYSSLTAKIARDLSSFSSPQRLDSRPKYVDVSYISGTSCIVERLFSRAKTTIRDLRSSMTKENLENILFLYANRQMWNIDTVNSVVTILKGKIGTGRKRSIKLTRTDASVNINCGQSSDDDDDDEEEEEEEEEEVEVDGDSNADVTTRLLLLRKVLKVPW